MNHLTIYKASAGSGKTFTLATEYIAMLISNPTAYRHILAVTFTQKATGEMKERILQQLYGVWVGDPASEAYLQHIRGRLLQTGRRSDRLLAEGDEQVIRQRAGQAMLLMLHDYSRFNVKTIDSFFQSVMQNLVRELGLSPNLNIELDGESIVNTSVDSMMEKLNDRSPALPVLADYVDDQLENGLSWQVNTVVKRFAMNLTLEEYMQRGDELRKQLDDPGLMRRYRADMRSIEKKGLGGLKECSRRFFDLLEENGLNAIDLKGGTRSVASYFNKLKRGEIGDEIWNTTAQGCAEEAENWSAKNSPLRERIVDLARRELMPLLIEAETERQKVACDVNSARLSVERINELGLLNHVDKEMRLVNQHLNRFLLSDTNDLLHKLVDKDDAPFVFEKAGTEISHVMIDEFQDTSHMQWGNFRTLLLEGLAQNLGSLLVGDVKQAIYRWRNGDWEILERLTRKDEEQEFPTEVRTLDTNFRSRKHVVCFNNRLFSLASNYLADQLGEGEAASQLRNAYGDVAQRPNKQEENGYVRCMLVEADDADDYEEQMFADFASELKRLVDLGVRLDDMAILVRRNEDGMRMANYITCRLGLPVTSNEAFQLDSSPAVGILVSALCVLLDPNDKLASVKLAKNISDLFSKTPDVSAEDSRRFSQIFERPGEVIPEEFADNMARLRRLPLYDLVEELARLFHLSEASGQDAYVFAFLDAVIDYMRTNPSDIARFLTYWDDTLHKKSIPAGRAEGIRILTIHKAKGLEFHTVFIPYCSWKLDDSKRGHFVWCEPKSEPYNALSLLPITFKKVMEQSIYADDYRREQLQLWVDSLNLLYVATTRATDNLLTWGNIKKAGQKKKSGGASTEEEGTKTVAYLMKTLLPQVAGYEGRWDEGSRVYLYGEPMPSKAKEHREESINKLTWQAEEVPVTLRTLPPVTRFIQSNQSAMFIEGEDSEENKRVIARGNLLHELFSRIATQDDVEPAILQLENSGLIASDEERDDLRRIVTHAFELPAVRDWYSGRWRLYRENAIIAREGRRTYVRRPDRVMTCGEDTVVVDFKFAVPRAAHYEQVREYMQLLTGMGRSKDKLRGYLWYVYRGKVEEVKFD